MSLVFGRVGGGIVRRWSQEAKERPGWQKMTESSDGRKAVPPTNPLKWKEKRMSALKNFKIAAVIAAVLMTLTIETQAFSASVPSVHGIQAAQAAQKAQQSTLSIEAAAVNLDVLVTDQDGRVLNGLSKDNFRVLDNGKAQRI